MSFFHKSPLLAIIGVIAFAVPIMTQIQLPELLQKAVLYDQVNCEGVSVEVSQSIPDLSVDNLRQNFIQNGEPGLHLGYGIGTQCSCENINLATGSRRSLRTIGLPSDIFADTFTLFEYKYFTGEQECITEDRASLNLAGRHGSFTITGRSNWTIFELTDFSGQSICLVTGGYNMERPMPHLSMDIENAGIHFGILRSARKGCENYPSVVVEN
ncbi:unnamed protein product [Orchesella dallaii]|uniref:Uncharacterized protein n=1 Tax=Orchesella dallaii TaxID=48710 RepID=A0ABP1RLA9_9HEXA